MGTLLLCLPVTVGGTGGKRGAIPSAEGSTAGLRFWSLDVLADFKLIIQIEEP